MTKAEARFNKYLRPRKPEGSLGRTAQDVHLDSHTAPELCVRTLRFERLLLFPLPLLRKFQTSEEKQFDLALGTVRPRSRNSSSSLSEQLALALVST